MLEINPLFLCFSHVFRFERFEFPLEREIPDRLLETSLKVASQAFFVNDDPLQKEEPRTKSCEVLRIYTPPTAAGVSAPKSDVSRSYPKHHSVPFHLRNRT